MADGELFTGLTGLGQSGTVVQIVSREDELPQHVSNQQMSSQRKTRNVQNEVIATTSSMDLNGEGATTTTTLPSIGNMKVALANSNDGTLLTETFTIPSEGIDVSALASQLGTTEEGITLLLQPNNIIENSLQSGEAGGFLTTEHEGNYGGNSNNQEKEHRMDEGDFAEHVQLAEREVQQEGQQEVFVITRDSGSVEGGTDFWYIS